MKWATLLDWALRLVLGGVLLFAGGMKVGDPASLAETMGNYRLLPPVMVWPLAWYLPWLELVVGGLLVTGVWRGVSIGLAGVLFAVFTLVTAQAAWRGIDLTCGCFGSGGVGGGGVTPGWATAHNLALVAAAGIELWVFQKR